MKTYTIEEVQNAVNQMLGKHWATCQASVEVTSVVGENRGLLTMTYTPYNNRPQTHSEFVELVTDDFDGDMHMLYLELASIVRGV